MRFGKGTRRNLRARDRRAESKYTGGKKKHCRQANRAAHSSGLVLAARSVAQSGNQSIRSSFRRPVFAACVVFDAIVFHSGLKKQEQIGRRQAG